MWCGSRPRAGAWWSGPRPRSARRALSCVRSTGWAARRRRRKACRSPSSCARRAPPCRRCSFPAARSVSPRPRPPWPRARPASSIAAAACWAAASSPAPSGPRRHERGGSMSTGELIEILRKRATGYPKLGYKVKVLLEEGGVIFWDGTSDQPAIGEEDGEADTTLRLSEENFRKFLAGSLDPTLAYMTGKLKVEGKLGVAMKINAML